MLISCICYKQYFYFLIFWILELLVSIFKNLIYNHKFFGEFIENDITDEYIDLISLNIADLWAGFLVLYTKYSFKKKEIKKGKKGDINLIYQHNTPFNPNKKLQLLILISFLDFISRSGYFWFSFFINKGRMLNRYNLDIIIAIDILMRYFFSRIILKTYLYNHHITAIIISIIGFVSMSLLDIISIIIEGKDVSNKFLFLLFILPRSIFYPLEDVLNKILLSNDFLLPHTLMYDRGLIEFIIIFIISLILFLTGKLTLTFKYGEEAVYIILFRIVNIIISFAEAFCLMEVIYIFTSQYVSFLIVSESFAGVLNFWINININDGNSPSPYKNNTFIFIDILSLITITFGTLMYNEMIIINKWGLQENTKTGLLLKEQNDFIIAMDEVGGNNDENDNTINDISINSNY